MRHLPRRAPLAQLSAGRFKLLAIQGRAGDRQLKRRKQIDPAGEGDALSRRRKRTDETSAIAFAYPIIRWLGGNLRGDRLPEEWREMRRDLVGRCSIAIGQECLGEHL